MDNVVELLDDERNIFLVKKFDGHNFPTLTLGNVEDHLQTIKNWKCREDDVFLLTYPRCGTHWTREIISMLQRGEATYIDKTIPDVPVDYAPLEDFDKLESPRPLFAHLYFRYLPKTFVENKGKVVHVTRNPKDCAVSWYIIVNKYKDPLRPDHVMYNGSWEQFLKMFYRGDLPCGSFVEYHKQLEKSTQDYPIHTIYYEEIQKNPLAEIKRLADFLEVPYTDKLIEDIAENCSFAALRKEKTDNKTDFFIESSFDGTEIFYRKGQVGDWKNWFTVAQSEEFDEWIEREMKGSRFKFQYSL